MKVLQAFNSLTVGGVQKIIVDVAENVPEHHFDVIVIGKEEGCHEKHFRELGGTVFRIAEYEGNNRFRKIAELFIKKFRMITKTYQILKKYGPYDAIHSHSQFRSGFTNAAAFFAGVNIRIAHSHSDKLAQQYGVFRKLLFNFYRVMVLVFSNVRLACSENSAKHMFWKVKRAEIIPNGTDMEKFDSGKYQYESGEYVNYIHVGRYVVQKNHMFLLEVFACILKHQPGSRLKLVGYGNGENKIKERVGKPDLIGKVEMLPPDSDVPKLLAGAEFMIFPSSNEGFPNVHIEAQVMGVECFVSDSVTRGSDLGLSTYISLDKSPDEWAEIILSKIRNHDFTSRSQISTAQKNRVDAARICRRYKEIYEGKI